MSARPYRDRPPVEPDPEAARRLELERIGPLRSVHAPAPASLRAFLGPVLLAAFVEGIGVALGPVLVVTPFALAILALASLPIWRTRGRRVELHEAGIVAITREGRDVIAFDDVDEVWFRLDPFQPRFTAIRALWLTDHARGRHEIPLEVNGAPTLAGAILKACSTPLLAEARRALKDGERLVFGDVTLEGDTVQVGRAHARWSDLRLAVAERGTIALYRSNPLFAWRRIRLDRVPHPTVLMGLVQGRAAKMRVDDTLLIPYATSEERALARAALGPGASLQRMMVGGALFLGGVIVTLFSVAAKSGYVYVAFGPIVAGGVLFATGLAAYLSRKR